MGSPCNIWWKLEWRSLAPGYLLVAHHMHDDNFLPGLNYCTSATITGSLPPILVYEGTVLTPSPSRGVPLGVTPLLTPLQTWPWLPIMISIPPSKSDELLTKNKGSNPKATSKQPCVDPSLDQTTPLSDPIELSEKLTELRQPRNSELTKYHHEEICSLEENHNKTYNLNIGKPQTTLQKNSLLKITNIPLKTYDYYTNVLKPFGALSRLRIDWNYTSNLSTLYVDYEQDTDENKLIMNKGTEWNIQRIRPHQIPPSNNKWYHVNTGKAQSNITMTQNEKRKRIRRPPPKWFVAKYKEGHRNTIRALLSIKKQIGEIENSQIKK